MVGPDGAVRIPALKARALLWYLAAPPGRTFIRSPLAALLREDADEPRGRNSLTTALNGLRKALPAWPLATTADRVGWHAGAGCELDAGRLWPWDAMRPDGREGAADIVALGRGPFLEGFGRPDRAQDRVGHWIEDGICRAAIAAICAWVWVRRS